MARSKWGGGTMRYLTVLALIFCLASCAHNATEYEKAGRGFGYSEEEIESGFWRVTFLANPQTSRETTQVYWLYRCAEIALEKGYDGFENLSGLLFSRNGDGYFDGGIKVAAAGPIIIPMYTPSPSLQPSLRFTGDIRLIRKPFTQYPPKVFNASEIKIMLEPLINGKRCDNGNICPHVHRYLFAPGQGVN